MADQALLLSLRLLTGRFHGAGDWPPAPFRLFQALIAGAYGGRWRSEPTEAKDAAFRWLEHLDAPLISVPAHRRSRPHTAWVPNNDLDTQGGDPARVSELRIAKTTRARVVSPDAALIYAWRFSGDGTHAALLAELAARLHSFGHGVDAAAAEADILPWDAAGTVLWRRGPPARPSGPGDLACPVPGSLDSLHARCAAFRSRLRPPTSRKQPTLFVQPPKPMFRGVAYDRPPSRLLFELRQADEPSRFCPVALERIVALTEAVRDVARGRLQTAMPARTAEIARFIAGLDAEPADLERRVRFIPLPSVGHTFVDPSIRRVLVEIPPECPVTAADLLWSLAGRELEGFRAVLAETDDLRMLGHYGVATPDALQDRQGTGLYRRWRSVTPVALPEPLVSGRIDGTRRATAEQAAASGLARALRHAGLEARDTEITIRQEPWQARGSRADSFATPRFQAARLRHVELVLPRPVAGPLLLGDGRFLGLGLMQRHDEELPHLHAFTIGTQAPGQDLALHRALVISRAFRRAVMACVGATRRDLPPAFTGHGKDGEPLRDGSHKHLFYAAFDADGDGRIDQLAVFAPAAFDARSLTELAQGLASLQVLRVPELGGFTLRPTAPAPALGGTSRIWRTHTPYLPTRFPSRRADPAQAVASDVAAECSRRALPRPEIACDELRRGPRGGLSAHLTLSFATAIPGPVLLGRDCHFGAGLFVAG